MNESTILRKIAKSIRNQNLFSTVKEISSIKLFHNDVDLSLLQQIYLSYLYFYHNIYTDIHLNKIKDIVLKDEIYEDAYMEWKKHDDAKEEKDKPETQKELHVVFHKRKKKNERRTL